MTRTTATTNGITYSGTGCSHCQVRYIDCVEHIRKTGNSCCDICKHYSTHDHHLLPRTGARPTAEFVKLTEPFSCERCDGVGTDPESVDHACRACDGSGRPVLDVLVDGEVVLRCHVQSVDARDDGRYDVRIEPL